MAEILKMLKDNRLYPEAINKDDLAALIRLINQKTLHRSSLDTLPFEGFVEFLFQVAIFVYSRPPKDLQHLPPVESMKALVHHFEKVAQVKGENIVLF